MTNNIGKNEAVEILPAANGYIVRHPYSLTRDSCGPVGSFVVFESFAGLSVWLAEHFTHRADLVFDDAGEDAGPT